MTFPQALELNERIARALQQRSPKRLLAYPMSVLGSHSFLDVSIAFRICAAHRWQAVQDIPTGRKELRELANAIGLSSQSLKWFVPDELIAQADGSRRLLNYENDAFEQLAKTEDIDSFVIFLESLDPKADVYWQQVYSRLGLPYLDDSPHGDFDFDPVKETVTYKTYGEWKRGQKSGCMLASICFGGLVWLIGKGWI